MIHKLLLSPLRGLTPTANCCRRFAAETCKFTGLAVLFLLMGSASTAKADDALPTEDDYYRITTFEIPEGVVLEGGAFCLMSDGRMAVSSRRGEVWMIADPFAETVGPEQFHLFAHGLHEVLGLAERDGWLYITQRCDVSRIRDTDSDDVADDFEVVNAGWEISGDYHEYAFGSKFDADGNIWVVLCLTGSFSSDVLYRGWCVRVNENGELIPTCSGIRSPGGIGFDAAGNVFYTDNQGPWNGTSGLKHLIPGKFVGHPGGFRWYEIASDAMGPRPTEPESGSRFVAQADRIPEYEPPAVLFPYQKMGQSASGVTCDTSGGAFGPFTNQLFVADQAHSTVMRVYLEEVQGHYQGACFPFRQGFGSGNVPIEMTPQGSMFVAGTNRGWGSRGTHDFAVERLDWTGEVPFEIHEMRAKLDGFELTFTQPVDPQTAGDVASYSMETYTYIFQESYGSPEVDNTTATITEAVVSEDRMSVMLNIDGIVRGHIHELHAPGVSSAAGLPLLHDVGYYNLNYLPE